MAEVTICTKYTILVSGPDLSLISRALRGDLTEGQLENEAAELERVLTDARITQQKHMTREWAKLEANVLAARKENDDEC